ncbi:MAG: VVA0879 family protein [Nanoarchaeota archaeon]
MKKGLESLREAIMKDAKEGQNCFNEGGCNHEFYRTVPQTNPALVKMGMKEACIKVSKCGHKYCDKFKWIIDRANHYAEKTGKTMEEILEIWETDRTYWYMNYYQDAKQPELTGDNIIMFDDWIKELKKRFGDDAKQWKFKCPSCSGVQTCQDFIDMKIESPEDKVYFSCIGRYVEGRGCDWTLGGLFQIHKQTVIKDGRAVPVFEMA